MMIPGPFRGAYWRLTRTAAGAKGKAQGKNKAKGEQQRGEVSDKSGGRAKYGTADAW